MRLDFAFLATAASIREGLYNILDGGATVLLLPPVTPNSDPPIHAVPISLVLRILVPRVEAGMEKSLQIKVTEQDGTALVDMTARMAVGMPPDLPLGWDCNMPMVLPMVIPARRAGLHSLDLWLDGTHAKTIPFNLVDTPPAPQAPSPN